jgi:membrane associated rhomboid family serine protease
MKEVAPDALETVLRLCAAAEPAPWYPAVYAREHAADREQLDAALDELRLGGLVHITDWVQGQGQGYALTPEGRQVLDSPRELARLRAGTVRPQPVAEAAPAPPTARPSSDWERGEAIRDALFTRAVPVVSITLVLLNVLWFMAGMVVAYREQVPMNTFLYRSNDHVLGETGAISGIYLLRGEWWRLLTSCFVHIGLLHLGVNMYSLYVVGPFFEQLWGRARFLVLYLIAGVGGSCATMLYEPRILLAGASGALWGILTAHVVWLYLNRRYLPPTWVTASFRQLAFLFLINVGLTFGIKNISASAHFGGGAVGAVAAFLLNYHRFGSRWQRRLAAAGVAAMPVLFVAAILHAETRDPRWQALVWDSRYEPAINRVYAEVTQLTRAEVDPVLAKPSLKQDPQVVEKAIAALDRSRTKLDDLSRLLEGAGPFAEEQIEDARRRELAQIDRQLRRFDLVEIRQLILPLAAALDREAVDAQQVAEQLFLLLPRSRDKKSLDDATAELEQTGRRLTETAKSLRREIPLRDADAAKTREEVTALLDTRAGTLAATARLLREGAEPTEQHQQQAVKQSRQVTRRLRELREQWQKAGS